MMTTIYINSVICAVAEAD